MERNVDKGGGGVRFQIMNVLVPMSSGGERTNSEVSYDSFPWDILNGTDQAIHLVNVSHAINNECLEFDHDEALKLKEAGIFDTKTMEQIDDFNSKLLNVRTNSHKYADDLITIRFIARYKPNPDQPIPDNPFLASMLAVNLPGVLKKVSLI